MRLQAITIILALLALSCNNRNQNGTIAIGEYTFQFPKDFQLEEGKGIDSYVGKIKGDKLWLGFDYGYYSNLIVETPQEYLLKGHWKIDAFSSFVKPKGTYNAGTTREIELISTKQIATHTDSIKFRGADLIALCTLVSDTFEYGIKLPTEIKEHTFLVDTFSGCYRKIVIANKPEKGMTGIYIKDLNGFNKSINSFLALSMATSQITKQQQDSIVKIFLNVRVAPVK